MVANHAVHNSNHVKINGNQPLNKPFPFIYLCFYNTIDVDKNEIEKRIRYVHLAINSHYVVNRLVVVNSL